MAIDASKSVAYEIFVTVVLVVIIIVVVVGVVVVVIAVVVKPGCGTIFVSCR